MLTVDIENYLGKPNHPRVIFFFGSSTSPEILDQLRAAIAPGEKVMVTLGPGPSESVEAFLRTHPNFERDRTREKFGMTFNPGGWLKRVR